MSSMQDRFNVAPKLSIGGTTYLSVRDFGKVVGLARRTVSELIKDGNRYGKLPSLRLIGKTWIRTEMVEKFIFCERGRYGAPYTYEVASGKKQYILDVEASK
jgi:hypothetical protein